MGAGALPRPHRRLQGPGHADDGGPDRRRSGRHGPEIAAADGHQRRHRRSGRARLRRGDVRGSGRAASAGPGVAGPASPDDHGGRAQCAEPGGARRFRRLPAAGEGDPGRRDPARGPPGQFGQLHQLGPAGGSGSLLRGRRLGARRPARDAALRGAHGQFRRRLRRLGRARHGGSPDPDRRGQPQRRPGPRPERGPLRAHRRQSHRQRQHGRAGALEFRAPAVRGHGP